MSTRSFVARKVGDSVPLNSPFICEFEGRYIHSAGYPTGTGQFLYDAVFSQYGGDLEAMLTRLIDDPAAMCGWSNVLDTELSRDPVSPEQNRELFADWLNNNPDDMEHPYLKTPVVYSKRPPEAGETPWLITKDSDIKLLEWGYIFDTTRRTLLVYSIEPTKLIVEIPLERNLHPYIDWQKIEKAKYLEDENES